MRHSETCMERQLDCEEVSIVATDGGTKEVALGRRVGSTTRAMQRDSCAALTRLRRVQRR